MITGVDHVAIAVHDLPAARAAYEALLGAAATAAETHDGITSQLIGVSNTSVELMSATGEGEAAQRLHAAVAAEGEGLKSLVFAVDDIAGAHQRCERVGLAPEQVIERPAFARFRLASAATRGMRLFLLHRRHALEGAAHVGLDHVVIRTSDAEQAAALYGARLGLSMRLDREIAGRRLMFFRCGDAVVELACEPGDGSRDQLWGVSWRIADAGAERARLGDAGFDVSQVRPGKKPGTQVFTVRGGTFGVPTLMIEPAARRCD
ncbi:MAG: VOC family protein [Hyphomonadaceae bacterium]